MYIFENITRDEVDSVDSIKNQNKPFHNPSTKAPILSRAFSISSLEVA